MVLFSFGEKQEVAPHSSSSTNYRSPLQFPTSLSTASEPMTGQQQQQYYYVIEEHIQVCKPRSRVDA